MPQRLPNRAPACALLLCLLLLAPLCAGTASAATPGDVKAAHTSWTGLVERLKQDGISGADIEGWFAELEPYSQRPMGLKARALFRSKFLPPPFAFLNKPVKPGRKAAPRYLAVMNADSIRKSAEFLQSHQALFERAEREYQVEKEIIVALFMTETRLGEYIGAERALWNLASMAASVKPGQLDEYLDGLPINTPEREAWVQRLILSRSDWAYKELAALIDYCRENGHDPLAIVGSPFGAIGLCQFMPTNIRAYAVDGNQDERIDLFNLDDAVCSIANFVRKHGWKNSLDHNARRKVLYRYNHSNVYADTVLAIANGVKALDKASSDGKSPAKGKNGK